MDSQKKICVGCNVSNCKYNSDSMCTADNLVINAMYNGKARTSDGTNCNTFENSRN